MFEFIYKLLEDGLNLTKAEYTEYYDHLSTLTDENREKINIEIYSRERTLKHINKGSLGIIGKDILKTVKEVNEKRIAELE